MSWPAGTNPLDWALAYLERGWTPVPTWPAIHNSQGAGCSCRLGPACPSPAKHPRIPWKDLEAVAVEQAQAWWRRWPDAGIAIRTGGGAGPVVVDVDPAHGGAATAHRLADEHSPWPDTVRVATGGGGWHWYFDPAGTRLRNVAGGPLGDGVDLRADGGIVIAPPSRHASGRRYWLAGTETLAVLPDWLPDLLARPIPVTAALPAAVREIPPGQGDSPYGLAALEDEAAEVAATAPGGRNHRLNKAAFAAGQLVAGGELDPGRAVATLHAAGAACGLGTEEIAATVASGLRAGQAYPRSRPPIPSTRSPKDAAMLVVKELGQSLAIRPWADPWREANGFSPNSPYIEHVWSGQLGPSSCLLYRRLSGIARACPEGATIDVADLAAGLGLGQGTGRSSPLARSIGRLVLFGTARWQGETLEVRRALPPVPPGPLSRLGPTAQRIHRAELARLQQQLGAGPTNGPQPARGRGLEVRR